MSPSSGTVVNSARSSTHLVMVMVIIVMMMMVMTMMMVMMVMMIKLLWIMETVLQNATLVFAPGSYSESYYLAQRRLRTDPFQAVII